MKCELIRNPEGGAAIIGLDDESTILAIWDANGFGCLREEVADEARVKLSDMGHGEVRFDTDPSDAPGYFTTNLMAIGILYSCGVFDLSESKIQFEDLKDLSEGME